MQQIQFKFDKNDKFFDEDFILSDCNKIACSMIEQWPAQAFSNILILYGQQNCGKTHLASIWQRKTKANLISKNKILTCTPQDIIADNNFFIIEDIEKLIEIYEVKFLHLFNSIKESNKFLLATSNVAPGNLMVKLADLYSRLSSFQAVEIQLPDDNLLRAILIKNFSTRQLKIDSRIIEFLLKKIERSFQSANDVVELIDKKSLAEKKEITLGFVKQALIY